MLAGRWERVHRLPEAELDRLRATAQQNLGRAVADLNLDYFLYLDEGLAAEAAIDALNALECVELAQGVTRPPPLPAPPDLQADQGYLDQTTRGIGAEALWQYGVQAAGLYTKIADLEYSWNLSHGDFPNVTLLGPPPNDPFPADNANHGTAVLGQMFARRDNAVGVSGACYFSPAYVVAVNTGPGAGTYNLAGAITTALGTLVAGDVILIEQQTAGPNWPIDNCCHNPPTCPPNTDCQFGLVASEWDIPVYNAIVTAVGNGVHVVEAAGNGSQDLDAPEYGPPGIEGAGGGHYPFLPGNDSGAIIVGAGAPPDHPDGERSRLPFSNYGATVDLQGWGAWITTTGYGDAYNAEGQNLWYTDTFGGTSGASPIVAAACALLNSMYEWANAGTPMTPAALRTTLRNTGAPQLDGTHPATENIGPLPDVLAAVELSGTQLLFRPFCDGTDGALASCPCANPGGHETGCDNVQGTGGVRLDVLAQQTSPSNSATGRGTGFPPASAPGAVVIRASSLDSLTPVVFGDGLRCVGVPVTRLAGEVAAGGVSTHVFGHSVMSGTGTFYYQLWYRSTPAMFCDPLAAFNLSSGRTILW